MLKKEILGLFLIFFLLIPGGLVFSQTAIIFPNPLDYETLEELVEAIASFLLYLSLALALLMILVGAFYFLTAGGDPKRVQVGQKIILYTAIGLAVILFARGIIALIKYIMGSP